MRLGEILVARGRLDAGRLAVALEEQARGPARRRIGEILVASGAATEEAVLEALAEQFAIPFVDRVPDERLDAALVQRIPVDWARSHVALPIRDGDALCLLLNDPTRFDVIDHAALVLGRDVAPVLATKPAVLDAIHRCYAKRGGASAPASPAVDAPTPLPEGRSEDLLRGSAAAPVTQWVNAMLLSAVSNDASDVHVEPFESRLQVRFRVDGVLYEQAAPPRSMEAGLTSRLKVMARLDIAENRLPQDGMAKVHVGDREIDIRVSTVPVAEGERVVLRLLNRSSVLLPLDALGIPGRLMGGLARLLALPNGVVLVTGPTGSGKTTTLYAALRSIDTAHVNVMTIEDPIEYQIEGIGQIQVHPKIGLTFAQGLRHILRQDPDVVLVGEMRDVETAEIGIRASLTGHLVFSTLHTNNAIEAVTRLRDMGVPPYLIGAALRGVLAQRLVRRLCPACRREDRATRAELEALGSLGAALAGQPVWRPAGCPKCLAGYRGRTGLYELVLVDEAMREAIRDAAPASALAALALERGYRPMPADGVEKIAAGITSIDEVLRVVPPEDRV